MLFSGEIIGADSSNKELTVRCDDDINGIIIGERVIIEELLDRRVINRKRLYELYMYQINEISEKCDWKSVFSPKEIVDIICNIVENHPELFDRA
jgi:hypothetical protein